MSSTSPGAQQLVESLEAQFGPPRRFGHSLLWSMRSGHTKQWMIDLWLDLKPGADPSALVLRTDRGRTIRASANAAISHARALIAG